MPENVGDLNKLIVATGFEWFPKVQKIATSGHTDGKCQWPPVCIVRIQHICYLEIIQKFTSGRKKLTVKQKYDGLTLFANPPWFDTKPAIFNVRYFKVK